MTSRAGRPHGVLAALIAAAFLSLAAADVASAGTVSSTGGRIAFAAGPSEANDVTVTFTADAVTFTDAGAPITAGPGCTVAAGGTSVSCPEPQPFAAPGLALDIDLGTRDDRLRLDDCVGELREITVSGSVGDDSVTVGACAGARLTVDGGPHDDFISTSLNHSGTNTLYGGPGRDRIAVNEGGATFVYGGSGDDDLSWLSIIFDPARPTESVSVHGEAGHDTLRPSDPFLMERTMSGGRGNDILVLPPDGVVFDMADCVACDIEGVIGSAGNDVIYGDDRPNWISSGDGDDVVDPRGGHDTVLAGAGDDTVTSTDGKRDAIRCGAGSRDTLFADRHESMAQCEIVSRRAKN